MRGHAYSAVQHFHGVGGEVHVHFPLRQCVRHTVVVMVDFHVIVEIDAEVGLDLPPILRQVVKAQIPTNGELSHGIGTQAVQQGVQAGRSPAA